MPLSRTIPGHTYSATAANNFFGWIDDIGTPFTSLVIEPGAGSPAAFPTVDHLILGQAAPVPGPLPVMGAATAFGFSRRLRSRIAAARPPCLSRSVGLWLCCCLLRPARSAGAASARESSGMQPAAPHAHPRRSRPALAPAAPPRGSLLQPSPSPPWPLPMPPGAQRTLAAPEAGPSPEGLHQRSGPLLQGH